MAGKLPQGYLCLYFIFSIDNLIVKDYLLFLSDVALTNTASIYTGTNMGFSNFKVIRKETRPTSNAVKQNKSIKDTCFFLSHNGVNKVNKTYIFFVYIIYLALGNLIFVA